MYRAIGPALPALAMRDQGCSVSAVSPPAPPRSGRPDTFDALMDRLSPIERFCVRWVRATHRIPVLDRLLRWCQRHIGAGWIHLGTRNLLHVQGAERLPPFQDGQGLVWASNHRSFFDMYVANAWLFRHGYHQRVLYPVRSHFFYDRLIGLFVNGVMSFWSMYPPVFRDRKRAALNHTAFAELAASVQGGRSVGIHPEGTRNQGTDPYALLPAQSGIGRLIHLAQAPVVPFFVNGLSNDVAGQLKGNFTSEGPPITLVFGAPVALEDLLEQPGSGKVYRAIAERVMEHIATLAEEEKLLRARLEDKSDSP